LVLSGRAKLMNFFSLCPFLLTVVAGSPLSFMIPIIFLWVCLRTSFFLSPSRCWRATVLFFFFFFQPRWGERRISPSLIPEGGGDGNTPYSSFLSADSVLSFFPKVSTSTVRLTSSLYIPDVLPHIFPPSFSQQHEQAARFPCQEWRDGLPFDLSSLLSRDRPASFLPSRPARCPSLKGSSSSSLFPTDSSICCFLFNSRPLLLSPQGVCR